MTVTARPEHPTTDRLLTPAQRAFWEGNGVVITPSTVPKENLDAVTDANWSSSRSTAVTREPGDRPPESHAGTCEAGLTEYAVCIR